MNTHYGAEYGNDNALLMHLQDIDNSLRSLGLKDAATHMGALEVLALEVRNGSEAVADGLADVAAAIRETGRKGD